MACSKSLKLAAVHWGAYLQIQKMFYLCYDYIRKARSTPTLFRHDVRPVTQLGAPTPRAVVQAFKASRTPPRLEMGAPLLDEKILNSEAAPVDANIMVAGEADNRGNYYIVQRLAFPKFPLVCILLEIA